MKGATSDRGTGARATVKEGAVLRSAARILDRLSARADNPVRRKNLGDAAITCMGCDGCSPAMVNGMLCHEAGCPDAWRDYSAECFECGCDFMPEYRNQAVCCDCHYAGRD